MFEQIFSLGSILNGKADPATFTACLVSALLSGIVLALCFRIKNRVGQGLLMTLTLLPTISAVVVMLVGKSLGAGIALAGSFSLVRFRSQPGSAKEICALLLACTVGFANGAGYLLVGWILLVIALLVGTVFVLFGLGKAAEERRTLKITIPETLDYTDLFDDLLQTYTYDWVLLSVRTAEMGSLYRLTYEITLKDPKQEKAFMDALRVRNGNLEILCGRPQTPKGEL